MALVTENKVLFSGKNILIVRCLAYYDGVVAGEVDAIKIDKSTLIGPDGIEPSAIKIEEIQATTNGITALLEWDETADNPIAILVGPDYRDYSNSNMVPSSGGGTGDVLLTVLEPATPLIGDGYDILLHCRLKA